jgi:hypothetical protein
VSVLGITTVVKSSDRAVAIQRFRALLGSDAVPEFQIPNSGLTVTVLPGLAILSGTETELRSAESLIATLVVDSLEQTEAQLVRTGWTLAGSLGAPGSVLAQDIDGAVFEFVERT